MTEKTSLKGILSALQGALKQQGEKRANLWKELIFHWSLGKVLLWIIISALAYGLILLARMPPKEDIFPLSVIIGMYFTQRIICRWRDAYQRKCIN